MMTAQPVRILLARCAALLVALMCVSGAVHAQQMKVGFVNIPRILQEAPQAEDARERIEQEFAPRDRDLLAQQREVRGMEDKLVKNAAVMSASERSRQEADIRSMKRDLRRSQEEFRDDLNVRRNEELSKLQRLVVDVIQELARGEGYDLVVSEGVVYAGERVDITDKVISRLQATFKAGG